MNQSPQNRFSIPPEVIDKLKPNQTSKKICTKKPADINCFLFPVLEQKLGIVQLLQCISHEITS